MSKYNPMTLEDFDKLLEAVIKDYSGNGDYLLSAVGAYFVGRFLGWRVLRLMCSSKSYARHQRILGIDFKERLPDRGAYSYKSLALAMLDKASDFWRVVRGHERMNYDDKKFLGDPSQVVK